MNTQPTKRGVYYDIDKSPIIYRNGSREYHFSSCKKRDMFIKKVVDMKQRIDKIKLSMYGLFGEDDVMIDWGVYYNKVYGIVYDRMVLK